MVSPAISSETTALLSSDEPDLGRSRRNRLAIFLTSAVSALRSRLKKLYVFYKVIPKYDDAKRLGEYAGFFSRVSEDGRHVKRADNRFRMADEELPGCPYPRSSAHALSDGSISGALHARTLLPSETGTAGR